SDPDARVQRLSVTASSGLSPFLRADHSPSIQSFALEREQPIPALALAMWLDALGEHCGALMLRLKGLVAVEEMPGRPAVIHAVQHAVAEPEWLERWPSGDRRTRIVFIAERMPRYFPVRLLEAIEAEARDETYRQGLPALP
ncbi:MAG: GTP-binding protein, partial [Acetobacteraceae bacterium]